MTKEKFQRRISKKRRRFNKQTGLPPARKKELRTRPKLGDQEGKRSRAKESKTEDVRHRRSERKIL